jgi:hypothetical protein
MTYATVQDVADRLGRAIDDVLEIAQVEAWLDDVEDQITARFIRAGLVLADQIALDDPTLGTVVRVEANAVIRRLQNPSDGRSSITRSVDDASITERFESGSAVVGLSDADWLDLLGSSSDVGAFSTSPGFEPDYVDYSGLIP